MKYSKIVESAVAQYCAPHGHKTVLFLSGKPGGGKSACCRDIAARVANIKGIPSERIVEFSPSLHEPCDLLGLPDTTKGATRWVPPEGFYVIRKGTGPAILILEELSDATMAMQNPLCRVILDRHAGDLPLTEELFIIASGNRTQDKSGASRLSTKLANRMREIAYEENLEDWQNWAAGNGISPSLLAFMQWRPSLLSDFDPNRSKNPTPRSWEDVSRIPTTLDEDVYFEHVSGSVGEGAASEYCGFLRIMKELPKWDAVLKDPKKAPIPDAPDVCYATVARIAAELTDKTIGKYMEYAARLPAEYMVVLLKTTLPKWGKNKTWTKYLTANATLIASS